jgi:hypothetical protein
LFDSKWPAPGTKKNGPEEKWGFWCEV